MREAERWAVVGLLLLAAALRIIGLSFGQPIREYAPSDAALNTIHENTPLHPDEFLFVQRPLRMLLTGELNPKFFHNPSFLIHTNLVVFWLTGERQNLSWEGREEIGARRAAPFRLYITGRLFSALGGILAVAATYAAARGVYGHFAGWVAAAVVAVSLPMVQHGHYATTSSLAAGFVGVCLWASFAVLRGQRGWLFLLAGAAAGLAAGSRYNAAAVSLVVFVCGLFWVSEKPHWRRMVWVGMGWLAFPMVFVVTTPHIIFDTVFFLDEFRFITNQYIGFENNPLNVPEWVGLRYELGYLALFGLGPVAALLALMGVWRRQAQILLLLVYLIPYGYVVLRTIRPLGAEQMLLPIIPACAVLVASGIVYARRWVPAWVMVLGVVLPLLLPTAQAVWLLSRVDTRYQVQGWVWETVAAGAKVHLYGPYNVPLDAARYDVTQTYGTGEVLTPEQLRENGVDYLIVSDAWVQHFERATFIEPAYAQRILQPLAVFDMTFEQVYMAARPRMLGDMRPMHTASYWHQPEIRVYCVREAGC